MIRRAPHIALFLLLSLILSGCFWQYRFTGGKMAEDVKTFSVERFENNAPLVVPTLSQSFTEAVKDRFQSQTNLSLIDFNGDLMFRGAITQYNVTPVAIQGNETAAQNRLTITVRVEFENVKHPEDNWTSNFSNFADFSASQSLSDVESDLITEITDKLTQDIFNKVLSNW